MTLRTIGLALVATMLWVNTGCRPAAGVGARLEIRAPDADHDADVYVDGQYIGTIEGLSATGSPGIELAPGVHRVEVRKPGRFPVQRTIDVPRGGPEVVVLDAELLEDPQ